MCFPKCSCVRYGSFLNTIYVKDEHYFPTLILSYVFVITFGPGIIRNKLLLISLRSLGTVLGTGLSAVCHACGIKGSTDDVISGTGKILNTSATDKNYRVLLKVVSFTGNVAGYFDSV